MSVLQSLVLLLAGISFVNADAFSDLASCGQTCINNMRTSVGCVPVTEECVCSKDTFQVGIRDCAVAACPVAADAAAATSYAVSSCAAVLTPVAAATTTTAPTPAPETTTAAAPTTTPTTTTSVPETTSSETTSPMSVTAAAAPTTSSETEDTSSTSTTKTTSTPASSTSKTSQTNTSKTSSSTTTSALTSSTAAADAAASSTSENEGLSIGAKAGIGIGAVVGGVLFLLLLVCLKRRRNAKRSQSLQISDPLPGSGRMYAGDGYNALHSPRTPVTPARLPSHPRQPMTELEQHSRRYEEMLPRHTPRRMV